MLFRQEVFDDRGRFCAAFERPGELGSVHQAHSIDQEGPSSAYRQQALACAAALIAGPRRTWEVRVTVPEAPKILLHNVYGWFVRVERGVYALTREGQAALMRWPEAAGLPREGEAGPI